MKNFTIGDKAYISTYGPESTGTVTCIEYRDDRQFITIVFDKPLEKFSGWDKLLIPIK